MSRHLIANYKDNLAPDIKDNLKRFWRYTSAKDKSGQTKPFLLNPEGEKLKNPEDIANLMNSTFASAFSEDTLNKPPDLTPN
ncbi:hypothetical protein QYM36_011285 [Artemia franciscana]|uniref:Uncharacterized protein n=1 Tax=Artemia franciscana TaxID=6661 RepID=A0AA88HUV9_ARTSF|nr:hypothetical protein QYM36_011285 [Artemia franciscana]